MSWASTGPAAFIAGDWGTTAARFWLCDARGEALESREGTGIAFFSGDAEACGAAFDDTVAGWPRLPAVLCGMVGANIGWRDAGYATAPVPLSGLGSRAVRFVHGRREIAILPGVRTVNSLGEVDLMRGEETQIAGACVPDDLAEGSFALPGTHNKWVRVRDGRLEQFRTAVSGELFAALSGHSVLVAPRSDPPELGLAFDEGVQLALRHRGADLVALLFAVRARQIAGTLDRREGGSFLSGLIVGADIAGALPMVREADEEVRLICSEALGATYARALELAGTSSCRMSGADCARRGLALAFAALG